MKLTGKFVERDIEEFVGWFNRKKATRAAYAQLTMREALALVAGLDPDSLPWSVSTVAACPEYFG